MNESIVITGMGVVSPIGSGTDEFTQALFSGSSGCGPSELAAEEGGEALPAFEVKDFDPRKWLGRKGLRVLDRSGRLLAVAAHLALESSGLFQEKESEGDPGLGLVCGTIFGSVHSIASFDWSGLQDGPRYVNPTHFANTVINSPTGQAAIKHRLRGINSTIAAGLASGLYALHYATEFLRLGRASALLAGGVEELCSESYLGFQKNGWLSASGRIRPFEPDSDGTLLGEGSVLCTLETRSRAEERGARFLVEVCGFGAAHDAHNLISYRKEGTGAVRAIEEALQYSGVSAESVCMIISGANGHRSGDKMEAEALRRVFGKQLDQIPVCAPKAALGESLGASGALLAISAALALSRQEIPPTALFSGAEVELELSGKPQAVSGEYALITSCSCDGNNTALVLRKVVE